MQLCKIIINLFIYNFDTHFATFYNGYVGFLLLLICFVKL